MESVTTSYNSGSLFAAHIFSKRQAYRNTLAAIAAKSFTNRSGAIVDMIYTEEEIVCFFEKYPGLRKAWAEHCGIEEFDDRVIWGWKTNFGAGRLKPPYGFFLTRSRSLRAESTSAERTSLNPHELQLG